MNNFSLLYCVEYFFFYDEKSEKMKRYEKSEKKLKEKMKRTEKDEKM